jgi:hypothetical protein
MSKLTKILPFMESEELKELAIKIINEEVKGVKFVVLLPFLSRSDLDEIIELLIEKKNSKYLRYCYPFCSKESIKKIYEGIKDGSIEGLKEETIFPFLGKDMLKGMFDKYVKDAEENYNPDEEKNDEDEEMGYGLESDED